MREALDSAPLLRVAVKGDWGTGLPGQSRVTRRMCLVREHLPFDLVLTTGDNFYSPDGVATAENYYGPEWCLASHPGHQWRAAWGNHDYRGSSAAQALGAPPSPRYYAWSAGEAEFFAYDGTDVTRAQRDWLRASVCGSAARVKVIYGHQPAFSTGPHGSEEAVQTMVHPVAKECGVALVLAGHDHLYMRSKPIDGVTYVVSGGGGGLLYPCVSTPDWLARCEAVEHFLLLAVRDGVVGVVAVGTAGEVVDAFEVAAR